MRMHRQLFRGAVWTRLGERKRTPIIGLSNQKTDRDCSGSTDLSVREWAEWLQM